MTDDLLLGEVPDEVKREIDEKLANRQILTLEDLFVVFEDVGLTIKKTNKTSLLNLNSEEGLRKMNEYIQTISKANKLIQYQLLKIFSEFNLRQEIEIIISLNTCVSSSNDSLQALKHIKKNIQAK